MTPPTTAAILTDVTLCKGCGECVAACKQANELGEDAPPRGSQDINDLSATRWTTLVELPSGHCVRKQCRHCAEPACVSACLVGAMQKTKLGPVIYHPSKCIGCRYCMMACPYGIPRYEWNSRAPQVRKCNMCYTRLLRGEEPACTTACPQKATIFGDRAELLAIARTRIQDSPSKYLGEIYGEKEVGGLNVLMISDIPLGWLAWNDLDKRPLPDRTWAALSKVPWEIAGMGGLMAGLYWVIGRRMKMQMLAASRAADAQDKAPEEKP